MKKTFTILMFLIVSLISQANTYYVSLSGNDSWAGTIGSPWLTWNYGFNRLVAGDILIIRGGVYIPTSLSVTVNFWGTTYYCGVAVTNKSGTAGNPITVMAYPGEKPVLDCSQITNAAAHCGMGFTLCNYWYMKGLEQKNMTQHAPVSGTYYGCAGIEFLDGDYNTLEQCKFHNNGGSGVRFIQNCEGNLCHNCDSHYNYDNNGGDGAGGNADGFEFANTTYRARQSTN